MSAEKEVAYNEATQRYEMPFGHLLVYADVRKEKSTRRRVHCISRMFSRRRNCAVRVRPDSL